ncbi:MAG TPA: flavin reductase family protein [Spongiibacteraceae bacterium]|nr:flavin reductase family protein [Spongiibacteraceae bacterium]
MIVSDVGSAEEVEYPPSTALHFGGKPYRTHAMQIDPAAHTAADSYKLLTNLVVPRPIAWVTTQNAEGVINLAPFSFFNAVASDPLYVAVSVGSRDDGAPKDTAANILANGEFVVNLVTEELFDAMNISAADFPPELSEMQAAGLHAAASVKIATPRIAEAQASLECKLFNTIALGSNSLFIGEVVMFNVADHLVGPKLRINGFAPIGRMGSPSVYCRTADRFDVPRISYAQWLDKQR